MAGGRGFLLQGFCKVRFQVDDTVGRSVMYANGGSMPGGNSAFAHYGTYSEVDGVVTSEITSHRHNDDPNYQSLLGSDIATFDVRGSAIGNIYHFEGGSPQMPGAVFRSVMTPIADEIVAPRDAVGEGGHELGIGFAGTCDNSGALLEATALAGKRSLRLTAVLKLMQPA